MKTPHQLSPNPPPGSAILWQQVWGLATMLAAIMLGFKIYGMYQPQILKELGFVQLTGILGIIQGLMATVIEPLVGGLSDRILQRFGSRLPQITVGVTVAGLLFVVLAVLLQANIPPTFHWLFLLLMGCWLTAMIAIRGPIVALLIQFAPTKDLPIANSIVILVLGLVGAGSPFLEILFHHIGKSFSFVIGAIFLVLGGTTFYFTIPHHAILAHIPDVATAPISLQSSQLIPTGKMMATDGWRKPRYNKRFPIQNLKSKIQNGIRFILITLVGVASGVEINILLSVFLPHLQTAIPFRTIPMISASVMLIAAICAHLLGRLTSRWGANRAMQIGLGGMLVLMAIAFLPLNHLLLVCLLIGFGIFVGLVLTSMVPFALQSLPAHQAGLSTGLYFGGSSCGTTLMLIFQHFVAVVDLQTGFGIAAIAFVVSTYCLTSCKSPPYSSPIKNSTHN